MGRKRDSYIALGAVLTAFSVVFMYVASVFPTGQLGFLGVAALFGIAAVVEMGAGGGLAVWAASGVVGFLVVPSKTLAGLYALFFGPYPVVKALCEKRGRALEWAGKLAFFNLALTLAVFALKAAVFDISNIKFGTAAVYALGNLVFIVFDISVTRAINVYMAKIHPKIHRGG